MSVVSEILAELGTLRDEIEALDPARHECDFRDEPRCSICGVIQLPGKSVEYQI